MKKGTFEDCICFQLNRVSRKISREYRGEIVAFDLTHGQFFMLVAVLEKDGLLPSQLAKKVEMDRATTTGLLDRLERDGWIERLPDTRDRRAHRIHLTRKALTHRESLLSIFYQVNGEFIGRLSPGEWIRFQSVLRKLERAER
jgi:DNA-binding MarR family transcriptional regulator